MNWKRIDERLTARALEQFLQQTPFRGETPSATGEEWRAQITRGRLRIETDSVSHRARVRDAARGVQLQGDESALYFALKAFLASPDTQNREEIGLVLAGGGAKGAYQVGVWRALCETGLSTRVTGFSGVSIGAINTPLFLSGGWRRAYELWLRMSDPDIRRTQRADIERRTRAYGRRHSESILPPWLLELLEDSFISQPELERHLLPVIKRLDPEKRREYALFSTVTPLEETFLLLPGLFDAQGAAFADELTDPDAHYISWRGLSNMDTVRLLLASSAIPPAYDPVDFRGRAYYDGGLYDNVPIWPLYGAGYRKFVVVDLKREQGRPWRIPFDSEPCTFCVIRPGEGFTDDFLATFELTPEITAERARHGYRDALRALEGFSWERI